MENIDTAQGLMQEFAAATGLVGEDRAPRRYLWTDAFAACNYVGLFARTGEQAYLDLALKLVDQVHEVLAKHRKDSVHTGWLSGLPEQAARLHPTSAGLRIGKPLDERKANEAPDATLEWEQDGQYFHYLTRWMHALDCIALQTRTPVYNRWARELARAAHDAFVYVPAPGAGKMMYWKMSIDLSRPLVQSMGHHDPLDGLVTCQQLQATAERLSEGTREPEPPLSLAPQIRDYAAMCVGRRWATEDELGIGCMLCTARTVAQLVADGRVEDSGLLDALLSDCLGSLRAFAAHNRLGYPADHRLAFRELGLAIGLQAIAKIQQCLDQGGPHFKHSHHLSTVATRLAQFSSLYTVIVNFWLASPHRSARTWLDHADINNVMLATSLAPDGYLLD